MPDPLLSVRGLTRRYGDVTVLDAVDLDVAAGEVVTLVGPNGVGKSTLLRCITGLDVATEGTVTLDGEEYDERSPQVRAAVASVLDDLDFFPDLSVVEHLDLYAKAHRVADAEQLVDDVLRELRLIDCSGQLPGTLSAGQRRRLGLAGALVRPRRLLVLDEPEARLDTAGRAWLVERLRREREDGVAVLMACHDQVVVDGLDGRVVTLAVP